MNSGIYSSSMNHTFSVPLCTMYITRFRIFFLTFCIRVAWSLQFFGYLRTLGLKVQKAMTKIGVFLTLPIPILVGTFWNFKFEVLNYSRNCSFHATLIPNLVKPLNYSMNRSLIPEKNSSRTLKQKFFLFDDFTWSKELSDQWTFL